MVQTAVSTYSLLVYWNNEIDKNEKRILALFLHLEDFVALAESTKSNKKEHVLLDP